MGIEATALYLFAGIGGGALGFQQSQGEYKGVVGTYRTLTGIDCDPEICADFENITGAKAHCMDLFERRDYIAFHGQEPPEDWKEVTPEDIREACGGEAPDIIFLSPPCLPGKAKILTPDGPRAIETIRANDLVLTHKGRYRPVLKVGTHNYRGDMINIRLNGTVEFQSFTTEHPIWRRKVIRSGGNRKRHLGKAEFAKAEQIKIGDRIGFPVDPELLGMAKAFIDSLGDPQIVEKGGKNPDKKYAKPLHECKDLRITDLRSVAEDPALWFLVGVYLGDGYRHKEPKYESIFCVGPSDGELATQVRNALKELGLSWYEDKNGGEGNVKIRATSRHLWQLLGLFGDGAGEKFIPTKLMNLEIPLVKALIAGHRASDGSDQGRRMAGRNELQARWKIVSISLRLLKDIQRLLLRLNIYGCINHAWPGGPQTIMGRVVNTRPRYEIIVREEPIKRTIHEFEDGVVWIRVREISQIKTEEMVWNLEVSEDNTFCVHLMATHNCKGFSGLLPEKSAKTEKYQALNRLVVRGLFLTLEAFRNNLPSFIILENVPRITTRGATLLHTIKGLLRDYGYILNDNTHDCGEIGGLGQHRKRYLLVARNPNKISQFIYEPPKQRVRSIGEIIGPLPMPDDLSAGPLHRLPKLQWKTWMRLALIPAGGDWRDLENIKPEEYRLEHIPRNAAFGVQDWNEPGATVIGNAKVGGSQASAVADPRLSDRESRHPGVYRIVKWDEPGPCVTGTRFGSGAPAIADPRTGFGAGTHTAIYQVRGWEETSSTVTGANRPNNGAITVADPRGPKWKNGWKQTGAVGRVNEWDSPTDTVIGHSSARGNGAANVADPRLTCKPRSGTMGVQDWDKPGATVIGSGDVHAGAAAIADPRIPKDTESGVWMIIAPDGTWHRPLTTLELAALQGFPMVLADGRPLQLTGKSDAKFRERIGNAVPPPAARAIAETVMRSMLAHGTGDWLMDLNGSGIWVVPGEVTEDGIPGVFGKQASNH